jgi:hypothetical protein
MKSAKPSAFPLNSEGSVTCEDLRRLKARIADAYRSARDLLQGRTERDRLGGSAESRGRIEADFSCEQVGLLRG